MPKWRCWSTVNSKWQVYVNPDHVQSIKSPRDWAMTRSSFGKSSRKCRSAWDCTQTEWQTNRRDRITRYFQVGDTGSQVLERPSTRLSGRRLPSCRPRSSWFTVSRQYDAGHPSYDDVTGRQSICRRRTACLEQPSSCHSWSVTVAVNLRKAAENLFVCLRVVALVTYELAPWKCTD